MSLVNFLVAVVVLAAIVIALGCLWVTFVENRVSGGVFTKGEPTVNESEDIATGDGRFVVTIKPIDPNYVSAYSTHVKWEIKDTLKNTKHEGTAKENASIQATVERAKAQAESKVKEIKDREKFELLTYTVD